MKRMPFDIAFGLAKCQKTSEKIRQNMGDAHECENQFGIGPDEKIDFFNNDKGRGYGEHPSVKGGTTSCENACILNFDQLQKKP